MHPVLAKKSALAFSNTNIYNTISNPRFIGHAAAVADLFLDRFRPDDPLLEQDFEQRCQAICNAIDSDVEDTVATEVLLKMVDMVQHTLKTNVYMPDRYALSLRLDPACMAAAADEGRELPYGVLFVHGRRFNGFHVRFRDIARGGMRLVTPSSAEQYALESARQYDECYGLAFAQQLKNKDIPEGGSKAVNLINTVGLSNQGKFFVMRKSVKAMTDAILDLIVATDYTQRYMVDLWGKKEVLYLGPDEQVIPEDIEWIVKRAAIRGYDTPAAFMSSKPRAGYAFYYTCFILHIFRAFL
jgi:glutamate dehydrogenase